MDVVRCLRKFRNKSLFNLISGLPKSLRTLYKVSLKFMFGNNLKNSRVYQSGSKAYRYDSKDCSHVLNQHVFVNIGSLSIYILCRESG